MQADKDLLEMAAAAANYTYKFSEHGGNPLGGSPKTLWPHGWEYWNPLDLDGEALRLAVDLALVVRCHEGSIIVDGGGVSAEEHDVADRYSATRRAIVRAAAAIGEGMG